MAKTEDEWVSSTLNKQGDVLLGCISAYMLTHSISRLSYEGIERALTSAKINWTPSTIKSTIKSLIGRELVRREAKTYYITERGKQ